MDPKTQVVYRDASTGHFVTAEYAAEHPDTTVSQTVEIPRYTDGRPHEAWGAIPSVAIETDAEWQDWLATADQAGVFVAFVVDQTAPWILYQNENGDWWATRPPTEDDPRRGSGDLMRVLSLAGLIRHAEQLTAPMRVWVAD